MTAAVKKCRSVQSDKSQIVNDFNVSMLVRFLYGCLTDADGRDSADFENPRAAVQRQNGRYVGWEILVDRLDQTLSSFGIRNTVDKIRAEVSNLCLSRAQDPKGVFTLTVPTGGGKTLASLRFALNHAMRHKMDRVLYFVPFTTIIDQNAEVVRKVLEANDTDRGKIVLEHHSNLMPERQTWTNKILSEDWDVPSCLRRQFSFWKPFSEVEHKLLAACTSFRIRSLFSMRYRRYQFGPHTCSAMP